MALTSLEEYFTPDDEEQVLDLLRRYGDDALIVAGGTFVHGLRSRNLLSGIVALLDIGRLGFDQILPSPEALSVGATVTLAELQASPKIDAPAFGALRDALACPPVQIRNIATVGGNIAAACPYFDLPTACLALGAEVGARGAGAARRIRLDDFYTGLFQNSLASEEYVAEITLPLPPGRSASAFQKLETNANDLAIVNVAVQLVLDEFGTCRDARVYVGGGGVESPARAAESEIVLRGRKLSEDLVRQAAGAATSGFEPASDHRASGKYRALMSKVLTERALHRAAARLS